MKLLRIAAVLATALVTVACGSGGGGGGSPTLPETPVAWRGAMIVGERPRSGLDEVEAGWQQALAALGGTGPEPAGWTVEFLPSTFPCDGTPAAGCFTASARRIQVAWGDPAWPNGQYPREEVIDTAAHEFCHYLYFRRTGRDVGPGCLTLRPRSP